MSRNEYDVDTLPQVDVSTIDRLEVIDDTGRAYVRGSIYGTPIKIELSVQDDGRTLKVFVEPRHE